VLRLKEVIETPAIAGGVPAMAEFLPFSRPSLGQAEEDEVLDSLRSGWITTGPKVQRLEDKFCEYLGVKHAIAVSSCTAALHVSLAALSIGPVTKSSPRPSPGPPPRMSSFTWAPSRSSWMWSGTRSISTLAARGEHHATHPCHRAGAYRRAGL
jgi:dTDP-4-amino-4,6-dideoxygalactose transaminase